MSEYALTAAEFNSKIIKKTYKCSTASTSQSNSVSQSEMDESISTPCMHTQTITENGILICTDCNAQLERDLHDKEWKSYKNSRGTDPSRVQIRKTEEKSIRVDVKSMGFSDSIIEKADELYKKVTNGKIYRGNSSRKAIIYACVRDAYLQEGIQETPENLIRVFNITKKTALRGMRELMTCNNPSVQIQIGGSPVEQYIKDLVDKIFSGNNKDEKKNEIIELYYQTKDYSSLLKSARPQSYASALVYFWIVKNQIDISLEQFSEKAQLSSLTIIRNVKEVVQILGISLV